MSFHHFFLDGQIIAEETAREFPVRLSAEDAKHARVLRLSEGEHISVVDAASDYFELEITSAHDGLVARIAQHLDAPQAPASIALFQGLAKGDKMDDIIRHATEVGIDEFVSLSSSRCVMKLDAKKAKSKLARWQAIAHSAAMQSGRMVEPRVHEPHTVKQAVQLLREFDCVLVCWEECPSTKTIAAALEQAFGNASVDKPRIAVVVGPEGGLSVDEVEALTASENAWPVTLGPSILRTETAGIVAPALVLYACGGMGADKKGF